MEWETFFCWTGEEFNFRMVNSDAEKTMKLMPSAPSILLITSAGRARCVMSLEWVVLLEFQFECAYKIDSTLASARYGRQIKMDWQDRAGNTRIMGSIVHLLRHFQSAHIFERINYIRLAGNGADDVLQRKHETRLLLAPAHCSPTLALPLRWSPNVSSSHLHRMHVQWKMWLCRIVSIDVPIVGGSRVIRSQQKHVRTEHFSIDTQNRRQNVCNKTLHMLKSQCQKYWRRKSSENSR